MKSKCSATIFLLFFIGGCLSQFAAADDQVWSQCFSQKSQADIPRRSFQWPRPANGFIPESSTGGLLIEQGVKWTWTAIDKSAVDQAKSEFIAELNSITYSTETTCLPTDRVSEIKITVEKPEVILGPKVDESYKLTLKNKVITISAPTLYGARHGIVTLQNMLEIRSCNENPKFKNTALGGKHGYFFLPFDDFEVTDSPRLGHRGLMLDTSRGFQPVNTIKRILLTMSRAKMNVFHWHATDDQSFPLIMKKSAAIIHGAGGDKCHESDTSPCLGAYSNQKTYSHAQIEDIIAFATAHGVRVLIEVDMPSHARSWASEDDTLAECHSIEHQIQSICVEQVCGPLALSTKYSDVLNLAKLIIDDLDSLIPKGELIHVGMDEVQPGCWGEAKKNELMMKWLGDITEYAATKSRRLIVWQDVVGEHGGVEQPSVVAKEKVIPQVWKDPKQAVDLLNKKHDLIWSDYTGMYLDCGRGNTATPHMDSWCGLVKTWWDVYRQSPDLLFPENKAQILGGEVCLWAEQVNELNVETLLWPRATSWAGAAWESRTRVPWSTGDEITDMLEPQEQLNRFSFAMFRDCVPFTPMVTMWCYYGDTVGKDFSDGRAYCDKYSTQYLKDGPPTSPPESTEGGSTDSEGENCNCNSGAVALSVMAGVLASAVPLML